MRAELTEINIEVADIKKTAKGVKVICISADNATERRAMKYFAESEQQITFNIVKKVTDDKKEYREYAGLILSLAGLPENEKLWDSFQNALEGKK